VKSPRRLSRRLAASHLDRRIAAIKSVIEPSFERIERHARPKDLPDG
jgi:hypothetical protein